MIVSWVKSTISRDVGREVKFVAVYITKNFPLEARHRDVSNRGKVQAWRTLGHFTGGQLMHWPADAGGDAAGEELKSLRLEDADVYDGHKWVALDLGKAHEVMPYQSQMQSRYGLIAYTPDCIEIAKPEVVQELTKLGFPYTHRQPDSDLGR